MLSPATASLLAQTVPARDPTRVLLVIGLLIVSVVVLGLVVMHFRKRLFAKDQPDHTPASFMEEIARLRREGAISDDEYQTMRRRMVQKLAGPSASALSDTNTEASRPITPTRPQAARRAPPNRPPPQGGAPPDPPHQQ